MFPGMGMIVYRYGLLAPHDNAPLVSTQLRAAHQYRNTLIEIERARRAAMRALCSSVGDVSAAEAADAAADAAVVAAIGTPGLVAAKEARREAGRALREIRAKIRARPDILAEADAISERAAELVRNARACCNVYWGTYLIVEDAVAAMRKAPLYDDPRFVRWSGEGALGVQVQGGADVATLDTNTLVRVEPGTLPSGADPNSKRSLRRRYAVLAMRVGSDGRDPVWAKWRMTMHRPLPEGARIKRAAVHLRKIGPRDEWSVTLTLDLGETLPRAHERAPLDTSVAMDIGWRVMDDGGTRVAVTDAGEEFRVSAAVLSGIERADSLRATRDQNFDVARAALAVFKHPGRPSWWPTTLGLWKSPGRLAALVRRWRNARWSGDEAAYDAAEAWRYHDHHLWSWERSQQSGALRRRREEYRVWAAKVARRYATLVIEEFDISAVARRESTVNVNARAMRHRVAVSELRLALVQAVRARGGAVVEVPAEYTTRTCAECGSIEKWDQAKDLVHTCTSCHATWDQDLNAARNIASRGAAQVAGVARAEESAVVAEGRWSRAARKRLEREARKVGARIPAST